MSNSLASLKRKLAKEWSDNNQSLKPTMASATSHKKVIWQGKCGHEWIVSVKSGSVNGTGCTWT